MNINPLLPPALASARHVSVRVSPAWQFFLALALGALLCSFAGCKRKFVGSSRLSTTVAGREIAAVVDGPAFIHPEADGAVISTTANKITVERARVLLDGKELAKLPAAATNIQVSVAAGQLTVTADGAAVASQQLVK